MLFNVKDTANQSLNGKQFCKPNVLQETYWNFFWLFVTFYTNFFKFTDFAWVFMTSPAENILLPDFSDRINPFLVKMRLSYRTISPKRCIVTYFWVNWVFNSIICLIVSRLGSRILWKLMKFCWFWKVFWYLKVSQLFLCFRSKRYLSVQLAEFSFHPQLVLLMPFQKGLMNLQISLFIFEINFDVFST